MGDVFDEIRSTPLLPGRPKPAPAEPVRVPRRVSQGRPHVAATAARARTWGDTASDVVRYVDDSVRMLANGATFGFADRLAGHMADKPYEAALKDEQSRSRGARSNTGFKVPYLGDVSPAEVIGGIASPVNKVLGVARTFKGALATGGADAFLSGMGYSERTDWSGMARDGVKMIPYGLVGGAVVHGTIKAAPKAVRLVRRTVKPSTAELAEAASKRKLPEAAPSEPVAAPKRPVGEPEAPAKPVRPDPEEGGLTTPEALTEAPEAAVKEANLRIAKMTDEEADAWAARVSKAEEDGALIDDPHYRAIMNVDLSDVEVNPNRLFAAINAAEEIHEAVLDRAATRKVATADVDKDVASTLASGLGDETLSKATEGSYQFVRDARMASLLQTRGGVEAVRALDAFKTATAEALPDAKEALKQTLGRALWVYQQGSVIRSNAGRALQIGQEANPLLANVGDDLYELGSVDIKGKLADAFNELGTDDLNDLLGRLRTGDDISEVFDVLTNPARARSVSMFKRTAGSFEAFMKSNALTPVTAVTNGVGAVLHDSFRNGLARRWAAARAAANGQELEALGLRLEHEAASEVYMKAHLVGLKSMLDRIKFDFWDSVESVAGVGFGSGKVRAKASASKTALAAKGTFKAQVYEVQGMDPKSRLRVNDIDGFNRKMDELVSQGGFAKVWASAQRVGAVTLNTVDAAGTAAGKLFTGAVDEWGKGFTAFKEKHALAARSAVKEAIEADLDPADIPAYVQRRTAEKASLPDEEMWQQAEEAMMRGYEPDAQVADWLSIKAQSELEGVRVALQDGPQTDLGQKSAAFLSAIDRWGVVLPYIRTPIRLLERGLIDYTPMGRLANEGRAILAKGGPEATLYKAQMELGTTVAALGLALGTSGVFVVTNGDWDNARNNLEGEPGLRLQIGDFYAELGRLDPFVTTLAIGGMFGQAAKDGFADYDQYHDYEQAKQAALATVGMGLRDSVLSKSYLKGLKDTIDMVMDASPNKVEKLAANVAARMVPMGGTQKLVNETARQNAIEVVSISDGLYRNLIGAGLGLPSKRNALGDPIEGRDLGVSIGMSGDGVDDVGAKLKELGLNLSDVKKTDPSGMRLTAAQLDRLRFVRGHEALDAEGRTMRDALRELLASEEFQMMGSKDGQQGMLNDVIRDFNRPARELLSGEDQDYAAGRKSRMTFEDYIKAGESLTSAQTKTDSAMLEEFGEYVDQ